MSRVGTAARGALSTGGPRLSNRGPVGRCLARAAPNGGMRTGRAPDATQRRV